VQLLRRSANGLRCQASSSDETVVGEKAKVSVKTLDPPTYSGPGFVFGLGEGGAWDSAAVGNPVVRRFLGDNEERWIMYYHGRKHADCGTKMDGCHPEALDSGYIGLATSEDGVEWKRGLDAVSLKGDRTAFAEGTDVGTVLTPNTEDWWVFDTCHVGVGDVQILNTTNIQSSAGVYWMFYHGGDFNETVDESVGETGKKFEGLRRRPGLALSQDGINFARIESDHYTGALFDHGKEGEWDALGCANPQVVTLPSGSYRMYYDGAETWNTPHSIGCASSDTGTHKWSKLGRVFGPGPPGSFDEGGVQRPWVVPLPPSLSQVGKYLMYYEAKSKDGVCSIGAALSMDGIVWERKDSPVLAPSEDPTAWDAGGVRSPCPVLMGGGKLQLYYSGFSAGSQSTQGIGAATCDVSDLFSFQRRESTADVEEDDAAESSDDN